MSEDATAQRTGTPVLAPRVAGTIALVTVAYGDTSPLLSSTCWAGRLPKHSRADRQESTTVLEGGKREITNVQTALTTYFLQMERSDIK